MLITKDNFLQAESHSLGLSLQMRESGTLPRSLDQNDLLQDFMRECGFDPFSFARQRIHEGQKTTTIEGIIQEGILSLSIYHHFRLKMEEPSQSRLKMFDRKILLPDGKTITIEDKMISSMKTRDVVKVEATTSLYRNLLNPLYKGVELDCKADYIVFNYLLEGFKSKALIVVPRERLHSLGGKQINIKGGFALPIKEPLRDHPPLIDLAVIVAESYPEFLQGMSSILAP